jgi:RHS repeat-associated protein
VLGRLSAETRTIAGVSKSISYDYNLDGSLKTLHYPSGRTVTYTPDSAGRIVSASDGNGTQYVSSATYYASGAEYQRNMPGIYFRNDLNTRLQVSGFYSDNGQTSSFFIDKSYNYGALHQNNGNVMSIINNKDSSRTQTFAYDALNRITSGSSAAASGALSWGETYSVDAWGNLMISPMGGKAHGGNFQHAGNGNNQATGLGYDAAGNLTNYTAPGQYAYDAENRIQSTAGVSYTYDADGNRVEKSGGTSNTLYWYGAAGIIAESDLSGTLKSEYVFFNGKRLARIDLLGGTVHYYLSDHLNSTSMVISGTGAVEDESDYSPFGTEYVLTSSGLNRYKFTSKERDSESGLDYFGARYYSNGLGRFITPDWASKATAVPYAEFSDPQTLNLYAYVRNVPSTKVDADGHCELICVSVIAAGVASGIAALARTYYHAKEFNAKKEGLKAEKDLLSKIVEHPNSKAAQNVNIDALAQSISKHDVELYGKGAELASDLVGLVDKAKIGAKGSESETEKAAGEAVSQSVEFTNKAMEAQQKVDDARQTIQDQKSEPAQQARKDADSKTPNSNAKDPAPQK